MGALDGIRMLNFAWGDTGSGLSMGFGVTGAQVIKIETHRRLDFSRTLANYTGDINKNAAFKDGSLNQLSVCLNLTNPAGLKIAKELVKISDVVAVNMLPGTMERLGLGYETLKEIKPDIIMLQASANGQTGPDSKAPGYAPLFAAIGGLSWMIGYQDGPPSEIRAVTDLLSGMTAFIAMMSALLYRRQTGKGQYIDLANSEVIAGLIGDTLMANTMNGIIQSRCGNLDDIMAPHNCYLCKEKDMWVSIAVGNQKEWEALSKAIGKPELANDPRFADTLSRWQNQEELDRIIGQWTAEYTSYEVMHSLQEVGVAAVPSMTASQIYSDPHLEATDSFEIVTDQDGESRLSLRWPWRFSATPIQTVSDGPNLGEHTKYVLQGILGKTDQEIEQLEKEGALD